MDEWQPAHVDLKPASYRSPRWLLGVLNERLPHAVTDYRVHRWTGNPRQRKLRADEVTDFLVNCAFRCLFDHFGSDGEDNFISEPYGSVMVFEPHARDLAAQLRLRYSVSPVAYHGPDCTRITFYKPADRAKTRSADVGVLAERSSRGVRGRRRAARTIASLSCR